MPQRCPNFPEPPVEFQPRLLELHLRSIGSSANAVPCPTAKLMRTKPTLGKVSLTPSGNPLVELRNAKRIRKRTEGKSNSRAKEEGRKAGKLPL